MLWLSYAFGKWLVSFGLAFIPAGIAYLTGWRNYRKWRAGFWGITFGLAGVISFLLAFVASNDLSRGTDIMGFFLFMIVALIIWGIKRGKITTATIEGDKSHGDFQPPPKTENAKIIIDCPRCFQKLRIPSGRHLRVTCRKCAQVFEV